MVRRATFLIRDDKDARIKQLESDLYMAREDILHLAPEEFHDILKSHYSCQTRSETYRWLDTIAELISDRATPIPDLPGVEIFGERGYCPLCRGGAQSFYAHESGFRLPEGLRRHLVGYGNTRQCSVIAAAKTLARESWTSRFSEQEAEQQADAQRTKAQRLATETLYVIGPTDDAVLADEVSWRPARPKEPETYSITWAEQRLFSLGFQIGVDDRKRSYTKTVQDAGGEFVIYADPRQLGEITFRVFDAAVKKGRKKGLSLHQFRLRDGWKNNLAEKIAEGVSAATESKRR